MGHAAEAWWAIREAKKQTDPSKDEALAALDMICNPHRNCDAEFEADDPNNPSLIHPVYECYTEPKGPIGRLIVIAFEATPEQIAAYETEENIELWFDGPYQLFDKRYNFY
jgi:hypothetical protein